LKLLPDLVKEVCFDEILGPGDHIFRQETFMNLVLHDIVLGNYPLV
jgi:hypothetical protein